MARRRKMDPERKAFISSLLEHYQPKDAQDVQDMLKDLLGETLQGMLEAEMDDHLGYSKYDYKNKETDDSRNGYSPKTVTSSMGSIDLDIPRDRKGDFEPQIVKKNQTDISNIENQVLSMYAKGMTTRDISAHLKDVYGVDASAEMISHIGLIDLLVFPSAIMNNCSFAVIRYEDSGDTTKIFVHMDMCIDP